MNDTLYQILIVSFSLIFVIALAMLAMYRPKTSAVAAPADQAPEAPVKVVQRVERHANSRVNWDHLSNRSVLVALRTRRVSTEYADSPAEDVIETPGCHPDIADYVFGTLRGELPETCCWVVHGFPVLVHPTSGIIFAFGIGTECVAMRLPIEARGDNWTDECMLEDDCISADQLGPDWAFMRDVAGGEEPWSAYEFAAMAA